MPPTTEVGSSLLYRDRWDLGWQPSADQRHGARNLILRGDNLRLDEQGVLSLRLGSTIISGNSALSSPGHVRNLHTCTINTVRQRFAQVDGIIFRSQSVGDWISIGSVPSTDDAAMEDMLGQFFFAGGTVKEKNDGNATREWGISATPDAPSVGANDPNSKVISTFDLTETPPWIASEGTIESGVGQSDDADGSRVLIPNTDTGRGTMMRVFGSEQDFFNYPNGEAGAAEDLIRFYVWAQNPSKLQLITLQLDCNGDNLSSAAARFRDDYYYRDFTFDDAVDVRISEDKYLEDRWDAEGFEREDVVDRRENNVPFKGGRLPRRQPIAIDNSGWAKFLVPRASFERVGNSPGKDWSTVCAIQVTCQYATGEGEFPGIVKVDDLDMIGGAEHTLSGTFRVRAQFYADYGTYVVRSAPSAFSDEVKCRVNSITASIPVGTAFNQHVRGEPGDPACGVELYVMGGNMNGFYLGPTKEQHSGTVSLTVTQSERDMLITNVPLVADTQAPPDNIQFAVEHKNRMAVLDLHQLRLSTRFNPESFPLSFTFPVGNASFRPLWLAPSGDDLYIGTTLDIFYLEGLGDELPDGTTDFRLRRLGVAEPPISQAIASEGGRLVYLASDGPRMVVGHGTISLKANLDLLYAGESRYGVAAPNLGSQPGRFRFAMWGATLYAIVPEGASDEGSPVMHVHDFRSQTWRREKYPFDLWTVYREPDGKIVAGSGSGTVHQIASVTGGTITDDILSGGFITQQGIGFVKMYAIYDDDGKPSQRKVPFDIEMDVDFDGTSGLFVILYADGITPPTPPAGDFVDAPDVGVGSAYESFSIPIGTAMPYMRRIFPNPALPDAQSIQLRTGTVDDPATYLTKFRLRSFGIRYRPRPNGRVYWDSGFLDYGQDEIWFRRVQLKMRPGETPVQVKIVFESGTLHTLPITVVPGQEDVYEARIGRFVRGRLPKLVIGTINADDDPFELYWAEIWFHGTGIATERRKLMVA